MLDMFMVLVHFVMYILFLPVVVIVQLLGMGEYTDAIILSLVLLGGGAYGVSQSGTTYVQHDGKMEMFRWWNYK